MANRSQGFWSRGDFRLVRIADYDNSRAIRTWAPEDAQVTWAWAVRNADLPTFNSEYRDRLREVVQPELNARVWAVPWHALNYYVCSSLGAAPEAVDFDPAQHCVRVELRPLLCHCGCGEPQGWSVPWIDNKFAVCFEGMFLRQKQS